MRSIFFFTFLLFIYTNLFAQQQYLFAHLHTRDGLASEIVNAVAQDSKGFIWIGTNNGLQRYDNKVFLNFKHRDGDSTSLPATQAYWLKTDTRNRLWILLEDNKVGYFNTNNFTFHQVPVRAPQKDLSILNGRIFTDLSGRIIFMLGSGAYYTYNEKKDEFSSETNPFVLPANWKTAWLSYDDKDKTYWISSDSGLVKYNTKTNTLSYRNHNTDNDEIISAFSGYSSLLQLHLDKYGLFWLVSWQGNVMHILGYDTHNHIMKEYQNQLSGSGYFETTNIVEQQDGNIWITGASMLAHFNRTANKLEYIKPNLPGQFSILYDGVNTVFEDRAHNLWICSDKGLYRLNPEAQQFHIYTVKPYGKDTTYFPDVSAFTELSNKDFVVATWGNGLFAYDSLLNPVKRDYIEQSAKLGEGMVWCIHQLKNGDIWRGHQGGYLYIYHASTKTTVKLVNEIFNGSTIRQIIEDAESNLWIGTQSGLVVKWIAANNQFVKMQKFNSPVIRLYFDKGNDLWICLRNEGIACVDIISGRVIRNYTSTAPIGKRLMISGVSDVVQYNDSLYLIASGGLNILNINTNNIRFNNPNNPVFTNTLTNLIFDREGALWITSANGVFVMNMQTEVASDFNENDGIQPEAINPGASYMLPDGRIAFGRAHDFFMFKPEDVKGVSFTPPVVSITGFRLMSRNLNTDSLQQQKNIVLAHDENAVIIQFSTLDYQNNYAVFYKLEGLDKEWILTNTTKEAVYSYLPPGDYIFKVYAQNSDGLKSTSVTKLAFTISTPFWQTWWFYSLLALIVVAIIYWFDKARMQRRAAVQLMRSNISDNLHSEVNNALQDINILSEIASIKAQAEPEQSKNYIKEINYKSRSTITAIDDMLWSINPANDTMEKFITRAKEFAASISYAKNAIAQVKADEHVLTLKPDMKLRHELMMIYKMALSWLVNDMQAKKTTIQLNYINGQLQINMFADAIKPSMHQENTIERKLKEKAQIINSTVDVLVEEKGVGILLSVKA